jgi:hypothetical protein
MLGKSLKTAAAGNAGERYFLSLTGDTQGQQAYGVAVHSDGSIALCGGSPSNLIKYNSIGIIEWQRRFGYGTTILRDVEFDSNGNIYVCGYTRDGTPGTVEELFVAKVNSSGTVQWQKRILISNAYLGWSISVDSTNSILWASGYVYTQYVQGFSHVTLKLDFNGTVLDGLGISGQGVGGIGRRTCVDSNGDIVMTGKFYHGGGQNLWSAYLVKFLGGGSSNWYKLYGDSSSTNNSVVGGEDVCYDPYSQHYFATGINNGNAYLIKVSLTGALQWGFKMQSGANESSTGYHVCSDGVGGIYVVGDTSKLNGSGSAIFIAKFGTNGSFQSYKTLNSGTTSTTESGDGVAANDTGPFVAGYSNINTGAGSDDMILFHPSTDGTFGNGMWNSLTYSTPSGYSITTPTSVLTNSQGTGLTPYQQSQWTETTTNYTIYQPNFTNNLVYLY